ncbi:hypothetical protein B9Z55_010591 [Caenorhabditis nigoni]|uniref:Cux N-terminal domain-containing protein n=1 Tax=Caenorhabditis nigoni TaxID=1611254 RepID=A0A2G5UGH5_9PELO|nr:hypothetical protein B9Z55_010591 [Caenorhabditis nigoni]
MEAVTKAWDTVDWERLQVGMKILSENIHHIQARVEAEVAALGVRQDDSDARKERLVGESNAYKDRTNKENRKLAIPLIKAFQNEFEGLLARSSAVNQLLLTSVDQSSICQIENAVSEVEKKAELELNSRLAEITEERDKMKEQHDIQHEYPGEKLGHS